MARLRPLSAPANQKYTSPNELGVLPISPHRRLDHLLDRNPPRLRDLSAILKFRRRLHLAPLPKPRLDAHLAPRGRHLLDLPLQTPPPLLPHPQPQRARLAKQQLLQPRHMLAIAQNRQHRPRPPLLHEHRRAHHIERPERQRLPRHIRDHLRIQIIHRGLDHRHGLRRQTLRLFSRPNAQPQHIRRARRISRPCAITNLLHPHRGRFPETAVQRPHQRRARRRHHLTHIAGRPRRCPAQQVRRRRRRYGKTPVRALHRPAAHIQRRAMPRLDPARLRRRRRQHDVRDRIHRAHLMKMHRLDRHVMNLRLARPEQLKRPDRRRFHRLGQRRVLNQRPNRRQRPMLVLVVLMMMVMMMPALRRVTLHQHIHLHRRNPPAIHRPNIQRRAHLQRRQSFPQQLLPNARLHKRPQHHVAADPRKRLQVTQSHDRT